jgi:hypothetical protein
MAAPLPAFRHPAIRILLCCVVVLSGLAAPRAAAGQTVPSMPRVRSVDASLAALIHDATEASGTFRRLVETINGTDGIVYVEHGRCGHGVKACLATSVTFAGPNRVFRIVVDARKADWDVMGSIGHELQHAIELLGDPSVTNRSAIHYHFMREATHQPATEAGRFETNAAVDAGDDVRREIRAREDVAHAGSGAR